ncbi:sterol 3beta-glucosyltransferase [Prauserella sediminis]|uniref:Sterol 3beta-glucosyltransferase n=1 Tax=Prauserella sediminis TaxID=577680 RepID=A0A839XVH0_9PSEU|nr:glycosyltransferase [Prauserella sediminis]MBB3666079.1 sterol 3beta-glucosyltransferase [Prauserella sediminis]
MRVLLVTHGTRGDVQPFVALATGLLAAGHEPVLAAPAAFGPFVEQHGVRFAALDDGPNRMLDDPGRLEPVLAGKGGNGRRIAAMLSVLREAKPAMARVLTDMAAAADGGADLVVHQANSPAHHVAEYLGVPAVPVGLQPVWVPTRAFPNLMLPMRVPAVCNRMSYRLNALALRSFAGAIDRWRRDTLGLSRRRYRHDSLRRPDGTQATLLQAFSRHIVPPPADYPSWVHTTGFWFLDSGEDPVPSPELSHFLATGKPPVFIGFGSMPNTDPAQVGRLVSEAVRRAGVRAVLASGGGGLRLEEQVDDVFVVDQVPHDWLFPRVAAVVHAGGAGTTGAAVAAGRPQVGCFFHVEQRFWAQRLHAMGLAPEPIPVRDLAADTLSEAIRRAATDVARSRRAEDVAQQIRAEHGVARAVELLESEAAGT